MKIFDLSTGEFIGLKKDLRRHNMTYNSSTIREFDSLGYNAPLPLHFCGEYCVHAVKTPTNNTRPMQSSQKATPGHIL